MWCGEGEGETGGAKGVVGVLNMESRPVALAKLHPWLGQMSAHAGRSVDGDQQTSSG